MYILIKFTLKLTVMKLKVITFTKLGPATKWTHGCHTTIYSAGINLNPKTLVCSVNDPIPAIHGVPFKHARFRGTFHFWRLIPSSLILNLRLNSV